MITRIYLIFLLLIYYSTLSAAEIDCDTKNTPLAKAVCQDARLKRLNQRVEDAYRQQDEHRQQTLAQWLDTLEQHCPHYRVSCLRQHYSQQIRTLNQKTWQFSTHIHPNLPLFHIDLVGIASQDTAHIKQIVISDAQDNVIQTLIIKEVSEMLTETETLWLERGEGFKIEDVNFDGYKDIRLMELLPAGANVPYLYWLYDPKLQQFVFSKPFSQLAYITLDKNRKQIISQYRISAVEHGTDYYDVDQYTLTLVRQELAQYIKNEQGKYILFDIIKQRIDGQLQIISQELVQ